MERSQSDTGGQRSLLQNLRASAAKQAENAPNYTYGFERPNVPHPHSHPGSTHRLCFSPQPGMSRMAAKLAGPRRDRSLL